MQAALEIFQHLLLHLQQLPLLLTHQAADILDGHLLFL